MQMLSKIQFSEKLFWTRVGRTPYFLLSVACPLATCMERGKKGTYLKGRRGDSLTVPGLQSPYEAPTNPDLRIDSTATTTVEAARQILDLVKAKFF